MRMKEDLSMRNGWKIKKGRFQKQNLKMQEEDNKTTMIKDLIIIIR